MIINADGTNYTNRREFLAPVRVVASERVSDMEKLLDIKPGTVLFRREDLSARWEGAGAWALFDFGRELAGGLRILTRLAAGGARWRITLGESVTEACSSIDGKNGASNDYSPRDWEVFTPEKSDLTFGQSGFRFARLELLSDAPVLVQNVFAASDMPLFEREATIRTNDPLLNEILETAAHTLKLCCQDGYIWDGIKRDRMVWCGDLNPEIRTAMYLFSDPDQVRNSLTALRQYTPETEWVNSIPSYSAWYVINLCDYCRMSGNWMYFAECREYALAQFAHFLGCINEDGTLTFSDGHPLDYFLDWSTHGTSEAWIGVAAVWRLAAQTFVEIEENALCWEIIRKLETAVERETAYKPMRAFQVLAGRRHAEDAAMLQKDGSAGFSTFMAYYILTAIAKAGGTDMMKLLKEYYGGMLQMGATSFWEDFDVEWLKDNPSRLDAFPAAGQTDIHRDYGKHRYKGFRHSLCHGWSAAVLAFIVEYVLGVHIADGGKQVAVSPHLCGLTEVDARLPLSTGWLEITVRGGEVSVTAPEGTALVK